MWLWLRILVKGNMSVNNTAASDAVANNTNKKVIFKSCAPFTRCISKIDNNQVDSGKDIDIVMPMYNLIDIAIAIPKYLEAFGNIVKINLL